MTFNERLASFYGYHNSNNDYLTHNKMCACGRCEKLKIEIENASKRTHLLLLEDCE